MRHILAQTNQNTHLAVLDGCDVVFLAVEQPKDHLAFNITVGLREPSAVTALGKSLLAFLPADERDLLFSQIKFKKYTDKSVTSKKQLQLHLKKIQTNLLAIDDEEYRPGVVCLAAPVFDHTRRVRYSIGISGLREVIKPNHEKFAGIVRQAGIDASNLLGYR
jgi:DNA-binding IclR family transcriptional regulator